MTEWVPFYNAYCMECGEEVDDPWWDRLCRECEDGDPIFYNEDDGGHWGQGDEETSAS